MVLTSLVNAVTSTALHEACRIKPLPQKNFVMWPWRNDKLQAQFLIEQHRVKCFTATFWLQSQILGYITASLSLRQHSQSPFTGDFSHFCVQFPSDSQYHSDNSLCTTHSEQSVVDTMSLRGKRILDLDFLTKSCRAIGIICNFPHWGQSRNGRVI